MFLLQFCQRLKWRHTTSLICHSEAGALHVFVAVDFHWVTAKLTRKRRREIRYRRSPWTMGRNTLPVLIVWDRKSKGIWSHPALAEGVTHPYPAKAPMSDLDFMG